MKLFHFFPQYLSCQLSLRNYCTNIICRPFLPSLKKKKKWHNILNHQYALTASYILLTARVFVIIGCHGNVMW